LIEISIQHLQKRFYFNNYDASFQSIIEEVELIKEKFSVMLKKDDSLKAIGMDDSELPGLQMLKYNEKNALPANLTKEELTEMRWYQRFLSAYYNSAAYDRYYEKGFDYFPTHVLTAGEPDKFKFYVRVLFRFFKRMKQKP
jgi:hypothetical protein